MSMTTFIVIALFALVVLTLGSQVPDAVWYVQDVSDQYNSIAGM